MEALIHNLVIANSFSSSQYVYNSPKLFNGLGIEVSFTGTPLAALILLFFFVVKDSTVPPFL